MVSEETFIQNLNFGQISISTKKTVLQHRPLEMAIERKWDFDGGMKTTQIEQMNNTHMTVTFGHSSRW